MCAFRSRARMSAADPTSSNGVTPKNGAVNNGTAPDNLTTPGALMPLVREERVRRILRAIESKPRCSMDDLAVEFKLSLSHLQHLFKKQTGMGLGHLLSEQRLWRAAQLLAYSNLSVKEIADTVGYEHASSFIRAFERRFTQAPRLYRQEHGRAK